MSEEECVLCPRKCHTHRNEAIGFCGAGADIRAARAMLHFWEEPCISGSAGAGAVFFSGCPLRCIFCQNRAISQQAVGKTVSVERLAEIFLRLAEQGAQCIDLVSATPYVPQVIRALDRVRDRLNIPVVYNTGGYERVQTLRMLQGYVDVYLPDFKYADSALAQRYSGAPDYPAVCRAALREMVRQTGPYRLDDTGRLVQGTMVRHLVLPGSRHDSIAVADELGASYTPQQILVSVMRQYTPPHLPLPYSSLNRRLTTFEYESVCDRYRHFGFSGYFQQAQSAREKYTPEFDFSGL